MMKRCWLTSILFVASLSSLVFSQSESQRRESQRFSSVYTDLKRDCKWVKGDAEVQTCKGYGGYYILIGYGNAIGTPQMSINPNYCDVCDNEDIVLLIPHDQKIRTQPLAKSVEWRMANGVPFAVIVRFGVYRDPKEDEANDYTPFQDKFHVGDLLLVRGLKGYERIAFDVDAKERDANEKARVLADNAFPTIPLQEVTAAQTWHRFFEGFRSAVKRRERTALKRMMASPFQTLDGSSTTDLDSVFKLWDDPKMGAWDAFNKILSQGSIPFGAEWDKGQGAGDDLNRVAPAAANFKWNYDRGNIKWYAKFSFQGGRWKCRAFIKCCASPSDNPFSRQPPTLDNK